MNAVVRHYAVSGLLDSVLRALAAEGKDPDHLTPRDLAPVDEFHIRGRQATEELAELAAVHAGLRVLDAGSGVGGSTRFLAAERGCDTTGLDLTAEYCHLAASLSVRAGLADTVRFCCGDITQLPFAGGAFDLVWTQHAQMNVQEKDAMCREFFRVLRPGGRFVFHDILAGPAGPPHFPVHWAEEPATSFLASPDHFRLSLELAGFRVLAWKDTTAIAREWYLARWEQRKSGPAPALGLHLLMGRTAGEKSANVARNLTEGRIAVFQGLLEKPHLQPGTAQSEDERTHGHRGAAATGPDHRRHSQP